MLEFGHRAHPVTGAILLRLGSAPVERARMIEREREAMRAKA